jgi:outer membrane protein OmpA-like peptidoglycan-associated protein
MNRFALALIAGASLCAASPSFAQTVGTCGRGGGAAASSQPVWVLFDLGKSTVRPADKPKIAEAVKTAKDRQAVNVCLVGQTDKLGDKAMNDKLALARSQAVAAEMIKDGYPANKIIIATNPEAFGDMLKLGSADAQEKDRRVTIVFR